MSYRLRPDAHLTDDARQAAEQQISKALELLTSATGEARHRAVLEARKRAKRLRAIYRLLRHGDPEFYGRENARLRDMSKRLSDMRDASALIEATDRLLQSPHGAPNHAILTAMRDRLCVRRDRIADQEPGLDVHIAMAIETYHDARRALQDLDLPSKPGQRARLLAKGAAKTFGRAHAACRTALETGQADDFHELRKRVKYHWLQCRLLRPLWPGMMEIRIEKAKLVTRTLGDDHDLAVLAGMVETEPQTIGTPEEIMIIAEVITAQSAPLRARAQEALASLMRDDPETFQDAVMTICRAKA